MDNVPPSNIVQTHCKNSSYFEKSNNILSYPWHINLGGVQQKTLKAQRWKVNQHLSNICQVIERKGRKWQKSSEGHFMPAISCIWSLFPKDDSWFGSFAEKPKSPSTLQLDLSLKCSNLIIVEFEDELWYSSWSSWEKNYFLWSSEVFSSFICALLVLFLYFIKWYVKSTSMCITKSHNKTTLY